MCGERSGLNLISALLRTVSLTLLKSNIATSLRKFSSKGSLTLLKVTGTRSEKYHQPQNLITHYLPMTLKRKNFWEFTSMHCFFFFFFSSAALTSSSASVVAGLIWNHSQKEKDGLGAGKAPGSLKEVYLIHRESWFLCESGVTRTAQKPPS